MEISLDLRTIIFSYFLTNLVSLLVMFILWSQSRKRFDGTHLLFLDFLFQTFGMLLIFLRGHIPDFISIDVSNAVAITGAVLGLMGLESFVGKRSNQFRNILLIIVFFITHNYFTFVKPDLEVRNLNVAIAYLFVCGQCVWLLMIRVPTNLRKYTTSVGIVFVLFCVVSILKIIEFFTVTNSTNDYFSYGSFERVIIISYQLVFILFIFNLFLMINKRLIAEIAYQEEKFSKAFHSVPYGIMISRPSDGRIIEANDGIVKMTDFSANELTDKTTLELNIWVNPLDRELMVNIFLEKGCLKDMEAEFRKKSGEMFTGLISTEFITIDNEMYLLTVINNIQERKTMEQEIQNSEARLKVLIATKDKFFSIISHDLRGPISAMMSLSEIMADESYELSSQELRELVLNIYKTSQFTYQLLENLLEWARLQQGVIPFNPLPIKLKTEFRIFDESILEMARKKSITLTGNMVCDEATADQNMLNSIIRNLVTNSIKFTREGGFVHVEAHEIDNQTVLFKIVDNGIGMKKEIVDQLFRIDSHVSRPGTNNEPSSGLGLVIVKEFVVRHGGTIWVESEVEKGSTFFFTIPLIKI